MAQSSGQTYSTVPPMRAASLASLANQGPTRVMQREQRKMGFFGKIFLMGLVGAGLFYGANWVKNKIGPNRSVRARINADRIEDMIIFDGLGNGKAYIGYPDGTCKQLAVYQEEQLAQFDQVQANARNQFISAQEAEKQRADQIVDAVDQSVNR